MSVKVENVSIASLEGQQLPYNPAGRITSHALAQISKSLEDHGLIDPIKVGCDGVIGDGHRRFEAAKALAWTHVDIIKYDEITGKELFRIVNDPKIRVNMNLAQSLDALVRSGFDYSILPPAHATKIKNIHKYATDATLKRLADKGLSPNFATHAVLLLDRAIGLGIKGWKDTAKGKDLIVNRCISANTVLMTQRKNFAHRPDPTFKKELKAVIGEVKPPIVI